MRLSHQCVDLREDRQKCYPQFRQLHGAPAQEEFAAQERLEPPNSIAYGGLPHAAFLGRSFEFPLLRDGKKVANLVEFHCASRLTATRPEERSSDSPSPGQAAMTIFRPVRVKRTRPRVC
jgi:hypothetical protein